MTRGYWVWEVAGSNVAYVVERDPESGIVLVEREEFGRGWCVTETVGVYRWENGVLVEAIGRRGTLPDALADEIERRYADV